MLLLLCFGFVLAATVQNAGASQAERRLFFNLFKESYYDPRVRPVDEANETLNVQLDLTVLRIINLSSQSSKLITNVWLARKWKDSQIKWNPEDYAGIHQIVVPREQIFIPEIKLLNNAAPSEDRTLTNKVGIRSNGNVLLMDPMTLKSECVFEPSDTNVQCKIQFSTWNYYAEQIDLTVGNLDITTSFIANRQWTIKDIKGTKDVHPFKDGENPESYTTLNIVLNLQKNP